MVTKSQLWQSIPLKLNNYLRMRWILLCKIRIKDDSFELNIQVNLYTNLNQSTGEQ